ncbi:MAG TPA: hypothetical protein PK253_14810, partial [Spirochaetota bacterium]|nr:hypothetical protein [Spirochaetota bacterium]
MKENTRDPQSAYGSAVLYFFSGTGNSLRTAKKIASFLNVPGTTTINIRYSKYIIISKQNNPITGMIFPTHGFTAPWAVIRFALSLPR